MDDEKRKLISKLSGLLTFYLIMALGAILIPVLTPAFFFKNRIYKTLFVFAAGILGGVISIQQRIKSISVDDLKLYTVSWTTLIIFPLTGGVLALFLYITFLSGIVQGHLLPQFYMPDFGDKPTHQHLVLLFSNTVPSTGQDFCKLLFWSFIAGFSERFVIDIINDKSNESLKSGERPNSSTERPKTDNRLVSIHKLGFLYFCKVKQVYAIPNHADLESGQHNK